MKNDEVEKQVEEAIRNAQEEMAATSVYSTETIKSIFMRHLRPAVLALLERRESEHVESIKAAEEASRESAARIVETWVGAGGVITDLRGIAQCLRQKGLHDGALARYSKHLLERREQEHAAEVKRLVTEARLDEQRNHNTVTPRGWRERIAELEKRQPELGPCSRHGQEFWVPMKASVSPPDWYVQAGYCTACAQEKAAPGGVSNVEP